MWKWVLTAAAAAVWFYSRRGTMSQAQYLFEQVRSRPDTRRWLDANVSGRRTDDLVAVRQKFGLSLHYALQLLDDYHNRRL